MSDRIMIFIPAYNCEKQLPRVLSKIDDAVQEIVQEVIIVDNRSSDRTLDVACQSASRLKIKTTVFRNLENYSLGGSIKRAFLYALEQGYQYLIVLHGDDQADIRDMLPLLKSGEYQKQDLVIGARFHPQSKVEGYSFVRTMGNRVMNFVCSLVTRRRIDDLIAGLNCYKISFFSNLFFLKFPNNLTFDAHVLLYACCYGAKIMYLPITWREEDQISNAKVLRQASIILRLFANYMMHGPQIFTVNKSGRSDDFRYESEIICQNKPS